MIGPATIGCSAHLRPRAGFCGSFSRWWLGFHSPLALTKGNAVRRRRVTRQRLDRLVSGRHHRQYPGTVVLTDLRPPRLDHLLTPAAVAEARVAPGRYVALCGAIITPSISSSGDNCQPCLRANLIPTPRRASVRSRPVEINVNHGIDANVPRATDRGLPREH